MGAWEKRGWEGYGKKERKKRVFMLVLKERKAEETGNYTTMLNICNRKIAKERRSKSRNCTVREKGGLDSPCPPPPPTLMTSLKGKGELIEF